MKRLDGRPSPPCLTDAAAVREAVDRAVERMAGIDGLLNA
jgi:hypothetical protein